MEWALQRKVGARAKCQQNPKRQKQTSKIMLYYSQEEQSLSASTSVSLHQ
jgi:hypothetical protein